MLSCLWPLCEVQTPFLASFVGYSVIPRCIWLETLLVAVHCTPWLPSALCAFLELSRCVLHWVCCVNILVPLLLWKLCFGERRQPFLRSFRFRAIHGGFSTFRQRRGICGVEILGSFIGLGVNGLCSREPLHDLVQNRAFEWKACPRSAEVTALCLGAEVSSTSFSEEDGPKDTEGLFCWMCQSVRGLLGVTQEC